MPFMPIPEDKIPAKVALAYDRLCNGGVLLVGAGHEGKANPMAISWWLFGQFYHGRPMSVVAVKPTRYTFGLIEQTREFVVSVMPAEWRAAVDYCGSHSGRDVDKLDATGLSVAPSLEVAVPSIKEAAANFECRCYHVERPPHMILTPEHRQQPLGEQHSIYFAEVLTIQSWQP